jgi:inositol oxygenase
MAAASPVRASSPPQAFQVSPTAQDSPKIKGEKRKEGPLASLDEWDDVLKANVPKYNKLASPADATAAATPAAEVKAVVPGDETKALHDEELGKPKEKFRNYVDSAQQERVSKFYTEQHREMTFDVVRALEDKYSPLDKEHMGIWEAMEYLTSLVDKSDPDTDLSQMQHALQTAESIRKKYPGEEFAWFHVVGLIHDLGKVLALSPHMKEPQWCVVGDTFPVGCAFSDKIVFPGTFEPNPDIKHPVYSTKLGIYTEGCGLKNVHMSWGHDEYLYQVCVRNGATLPDEALYMIRYHSFYPWHKEGAYQYLLDDKDREMLKWVKEFNQFDLYSKADCTYNPEELAVYYKKAIAKYFPAKLRW